MSNLQKLRNKKNLSQRQLSDVSGINVRAIQHYEQGTRNINHARLDTIVKLAIALDCKIPDIIDDPLFLRLLNQIKS